MSFETHAEALRSIATSTLTHQLQQRGIRSTFLSGLKPLHPELRMVGRAKTLRYVALREDLQREYGAPGKNAQIRAVEGCTTGDVLVIEARGVPDAATIGDIFATRQSTAWSRFPLPATARRPWRNFLPKSDATAMPR